jgi:hypothetical protein
MVRLEGLTQQTLGSSVFPELAVYSLFVNTSYSVISRTVLKAKVSKIDDDRVGPGRKKATIPQTCHA